MDRLQRFWDKHIVSDEPLSRSSEHLKRYLAIFGSLAYKFDYLKELAKSKDPESDVVPTCVLRNVSKTIEVVYYGSKNWDDIGYLFLIQKKANQVYL